MIYTTNFATTRYLPKDIIPISIALKAPDWWHGATYKKLAPSWSILSEYKNTGDAARYIQRYNDEVLSNMSCQQFISELYSTIGYDYESTNLPDIVLCCYERAGVFCHRNLVVEAFRENGFTTVEYAIS